MVVDFVTCAHVEPTDKHTNSYVKSFLIAEKRSQKHFSVFDDGTKHPIMNLDAAKNIMLPWPPTSGKSTAGYLKPYPTIPALHFIHGDGSSPR